MKKILLVSILILLVVLPVIQAQNGRLHIVDDAQFSTTVWGHTRIHVASDNHFCHSGSGIASSHVGNFTTVIRPCAPQASPSDEVIFYLFNESFDNQDEIFRSSLLGDTNRRWIDLRYNPEAELFYGCLSRDESNPRVFQLTIQGEMSPDFPADLRPLAGASPGGGHACSISRVIDKNATYQVVYAESPNNWLNIYTVDDFLNFRSFITDPTENYPLAGPGIASSINHNPTFLRVQPHFNSPINETFWAFLSPEERRDGIIHNACLRWGEADGFPCAKAITPFDVLLDEEDLLVLEYRKAPSEGIKRGIDFGQVGVGGNSLSFSAWTFSFFGSTGEQPEPGEAPPRDFINVLALDLREWDQQVASSTTINENDNLARLARMAGIGDLAKEEKRRIWKNPCVFAQEGLILVSVVSEVPSDQDETVISVLSSLDNGETWAGLRPAVVGDQYSGILNVNPTGNCITYDRETDTVALLFNVDFGAGDGGHYVATTSLANVTQPFPDPDFTFTAGSELPASEGVSWFGVSLVPWAQGMDVQMVGLQMFLTGFLVIVFAGAFIVLIRHDLIGGAVGSMIGLFLAVFAGLASLWTVYFYVIMIGAVFFLIFRYTQRQEDGGVEG